MSSVANVTQVSVAVPRHGTDVVIKVDLDDRAFLFPQHKAVQQLSVHVHGSSRVRFEMVFAFNEARSSTLLMELTTEELAEMARKLVESVYRAQGSQIVTRALSIAINVVANGYIVQVNEHNVQSELFLSTGCIWRVCQALVRAVDLTRPSEAN